MQVTGQQQEMAVLDRQLGHKKEELHLLQGSMVQANSAISTMEYTWHVPALTGGLVFTGLLVLVTWGGIRRIGRRCFGGG